MEHATLRSELSAFESEYLPEAPRYMLVGHELHTRAEEGSEGRASITAQVVVDGEHHTVVGTGSGPISAFVRGLRTAFDVTREACLRSHEARGRAFLNGLHTAIPLGGEDR